MQGGDRRSLPRVRVVLVRPEAAGNVGACARVVRNTGLERPRPRRRPATGARSSAGAPPGARTRCSSRRASSTTSPRRCADATYVAALLRPARDRASPALDVREVARGGRRPSARTRRAALVFGPETVGPHAGRAGRSAAARPSSPPIPTSRRSTCPTRSMIAAYEVFRARAPRRRRGRAGPPHGEKEAHARAAARRAAAPSTPCPPRTRTATSAEWQRARSTRGPDSRRRRSRLLEHLARKMAPGLTARWPTSRSPSRTCGVTAGRLLAARAEVARAALRRRAARGGRRVRARPVAAAAALPIAGSLSGGGPLPGRRRDGERVRIERLRTVRYNPVVRCRSPTSDNVSPHPARGRSTPSPARTSTRCPEGALPPEEPRLRGLPGGRRRARPAARAQAEGLRHRHVAPTPSRSRSSSATASSSAAASGSATSASAGR